MPCDRCWEDMSGVVKKILEAPKPWSSMVEFLRHRFAALCDERKGLIHPQWPAQVLKVRDVKISVPVSSESTLTCNPINDRAKGPIHPQWPGRVLEIRDVSHRHVHDSGVKESAVTYNQVLSAHSARQQISLMLKRRLMNGFVGILSVIDRSSILH